MANINRDIIETRKLASKGRGGDTMIREIDNAPAHVNAYEAYLLDNYGVTGEEIVKDIGSGTINPETGLKEYVWRTNQSKKSTKAKYALRQQASSITTAGLKNLMGEYEKYMGVGGFLSRDRKLREGDISSVYAGTIQDINQDRDKIMRLSGVSSSNINKQIMEKRERDARSLYSSGMEKTRMEADKTSTDYLSGLRNQMNTLLGQYHSTTGVSYTGSIASEASAQFQDEV